MLIKDKRVSEGILFCLIKFILKVGRAVLLGNIVKQNFGINLPDLIIKKIDM